MFYDLSIFPSAPSEEGKNADQLLSRLSELGWQCAGITSDFSKTTGISDFNSDLDKFSVASCQKVLLEPTTLLKVSRINLKWKQVEESPSIVQKCRKQYDLIACEPISDDSLKKICTTIDCDIVTLDMARPLPFRLNTNYLQSAVGRGIVFEILYSKLLVNSSIRRNIYAGAKSLCQALRGKNIIISSGTKKPMELRTPADVLNIATFFDLKAIEAKNCICRTCKDLLKRAVRNRFYPKGVRISTSSTLNSTVESAQIKRQKTS